MINIEPNPNNNNTQMSHIIEMNKDIEISVNEEKLTEKELNQDNFMEKDTKKEHNEDKNKEPTEDNETDWDAIYQYFIDNDMSSYDQDYEYSSEWPLENDFTQMDNDELYLDI